MPTLHFNSPGVGGGVRIDGEAPGDRLESALAAIGDINGDGVPDIALGAPDSNDGHGVVYLLFGQSGGFTTPPDLGALTATQGFRLDAPAGDDVWSLGVTVARAGDVNDDGIDDVIFGALNGPAAAWVLFGQAGGFAAPPDLSTLTAADGFRLLAADPVNSLVAGGGDLNGDGIADVVTVSNSYYYEGTPDTIRVVYGAAGGPAGDIDLGTLTEDQGFVITAEGSVNEVRSIAVVGDVNGDGFDDLLMGAPNIDGNQGAAYIVFGKDGGYDAPLSLVTLTADQGARITGAGPDAQLGWSVAAAGDVNGDGLADIVLGAINADSARGAAFVVYGRSGGFGGTVDVSALTAGTGFAIGLANGVGGLGYSVAPAGDLNGDGLADIYVSAPWLERIFAVYGRSDGYDAPVMVNPVAPDQGSVIERDAPARDYPEYRLAPGGDLNGDGLDDLLIGALADPGQTGAVFVVHGVAAPAVTTIPLAWSGGAADETQAGTDWNDVLDGKGGNDSLSGGEGWDTLTGGVGKDTLDGGEGDDQLDGGGGSDVLLGGGGDDLVMGGRGNDVLDGGARSDTLLGNDGDDKLSGGLGGDILEGGLDNDTLRGESGEDLLDGDEGNDLLIGGAGEDDLQGGDGSDTLQGGLDEDEVHGAGDADLIEGGDGSDELHGDAGADTLQGDEGDDEIYGDEDADSLSGGLGDDELYGGEGNDTLLGGDGDDDLVGGLGVNELRGGDGDDEIFSTGDAGDTLDGGDGNDVLIVDQVWSAGPVAFSFTSIEALFYFGSLGADTVAGTAGHDGLYGYDADDVLSGGEGNDWLDGQNGADSLLGGEGSDTLMGGAFDTGNDTLLGGGGKDSLFGDQGDDLLDGGAAADTLLGWDGTDTMLGGAGDDLLVGDVGNDVLNGGMGSDTVVGDSGQDTLTGGGAADIFRFVAPEADGADTVTDFLRGQGDTVEITLDTFDPGGGLGLVLGALASQAGRFVANAGGVASGAGVAQFTFDTTTKTLSWDADGAGGEAATAIAVFTGGGAFGAVDITLV